MGAHLEPFGVHPGAKPAPEFTQTLLPAVLDLSNKQHFTALIHSPDWRII
jgi:hypothetical protein